MRLARLKTGFRLSDSHRPSAKLSHDPDRPGRLPSPSLTRDGLVLFDYGYELNGGYCDRGAHTRRRHPFGPQIFELSEPDNQSPPVISRQLRTRASAFLTPAAFNDRFQYLKRRSLKQVRRLANEVSR